MQCSLDMRFRVGLCERTHCCVSLEFTFGFCFLFGSKWFILGRVKSVTGCEWRRKEEWNVLEFSFIWSLSVEWRSLLLCIALMAAQYFRSSIFHSFIHMNFEYIFPFIFFLNFRFVVRKTKKTKTINYAKTWWIKWVSQRFRSNGPTHWRIENGRWLIWNDSKINRLRLRNRCKLNLRFRKMPQKQRINARARKTHIKSMHSHTNGIASYGFIYEIVHSMPRSMQPNTKRY